MKIMLKTILIVRKVHLYHFQLVIMELELIEKLYPIFLNHFIQQKVKAKELDWAYQLFMALLSKIKVS